MRPEKATSLVAVLGLHQNFVIQIAIPIAMSDVARRPLHKDWSEGDTVRLLAIDDGVNALFAIHPLPMQAVS
jgi:hypothetical protein